MNEEAMAATYYEKYKDGKMLAEILKPWQGPSHVELARGTSELQKRMRKKITSETN